MLVRKNNHMPAAHYEKVANLLAFLAGADLVAVYAGIAPQRKERPRT
jgi:hypothetical protein